MFVCFAWRDGAFVLHSFGVGIIGKMSFYGNVVQVGTTCKSAHKVECFSILSTPDGVNPNECVQRRVKLWAGVEQQAVKFGRFQNNSNVLIKL